MGTVKACDTCKFRSSLSGGTPSCPKGLPVCGEPNGYYKYVPENTAVYVRLCSDCANKDYCHEDVHYWERCIFGNKSNWEPLNVVMATEPVDPKDLDVANQPHYTRFKIQPIEFCKANDLGYLEGCVIKYVCRYPYKGQAMKDLLKARDYIDHLIKKQQEKDNV